MRVLVQISAVLLALGLGTAFRLPREIETERTITIGKPPSAVFEVLNGFDRFQAWAPWVAKDPGATYTPQGPPEGASATLRFEGSPWRIGSGYHRIQLSVPDRQVTIDHELGPYRAVSRFVLNPAPGGTSLRWRFAIDLGMSPISRWRGLAVAAAVDRDCEAGLTGLKVLVEKTPPVAGAILRPDSE